MSKEMSKEQLRDYYRNKGCPQCAEIIINGITFLKKMGITPEEFNRR